MPDAIVIGAGPAGLAAAAALKGQGFAVDLLEQASAVGSSWRGHYDCLKLHTARGRSGLPGMAFPAEVGRFPSRAAVITYLEAYAAANALSPRFGVAVKTIQLDGDGWRVTHTDGTDRTDVVVVATGLNGTPHVPVWPQQEVFAGQIIHSSGYRNARGFAGQRVLVVGFGNSGGDIALDLAQAGVDVTLSQRGPVNILPKELFGVPITSFGLLSKLLGYRAADRITAPILRWAVGQPEDYGLQSTGKGPGARVIEDGRIPLIDVGTLGAIKAGQIAIKPGIATFTQDGVTFADDSAAPFDAVIAATGYNVDLRPLLGDSPALTDDGKPTISGAATAAPGLYFCSFRVSPDGQLFTTGRESLAIAADAAARFSLATA
ncbi:flavin-containing monooxygenase [Yoonia sp. R2331]|uniref:flavin-containing monooxygenase n=1 Tax=Yoonia sp. R2331 TaxID=3237238 RepID=UPI0034E4A15D